MLGAGFSALLTLGLSQEVWAQEQSPANAWTFPTPEAASHALFIAVQKHDDRAILQILHGEKDLISLGDSEADKHERETFVEKYREMHRFVREPNGATVLYIGAENWPLPIPLVPGKRGWSFDVDTGKREVLFRQIGRNEVTAIAVCHELVAAAKGEKNVPDVSGNDYLQHVLKNEELKSTPFHGYYFRRLGDGKGGQAGAAAVSFAAYPAEYRSSGVMTFMVGGDGLVYQKDLGPETSALARETASFQKDPGWKVAENEEPSDAAPAPSR